MLTTEDMINNNFLIKFPLMKSSKINKYNFNHSNNNINTNNLILKKISGHISPSNHLYNSNIISLKNKNKIYHNHNHNKNSGKKNKNNIYKITKYKKNKSEKNEQHPCE